MDSEQLPVCSVTWKTAQETALHTEKLFILLPALLLKLEGEINRGYPLYQPCDPFGGKGLMPVNLSHMLIRQTKPFIERKLQELLFRIALP